MPWKETCRVNERMHFITRLRQGERMTDLCSEFGISRKTGYKLKGRFEEFGPEALYDQTRAPKRIPHRTSSAVRELLVASRKAHPTWGPKKLKAWLLAKHEGIRLPAVSTIGEILKAEGLVKPRRPRSRASATPTSRSVPSAPNELWCADFKGQFRLGNGRYCYPLTITDAFSRYILCCVALDGTKAGPSRTVFEETFREYGLPAALLTDNGSPFASTGLAGLTTLSAWWVRLGIEPQRIEPGHPEQNGRHERMHRTLKAETARPGAGNQLQQQERFDRFREEFNQERPHEALGQRPPATIFRPSEKPLGPLLDPDYPLHDLVVTVAKAGTIWPPGRLLGKRYFYISAALVGHPLGLRELEDGRWRVSFMNMELGHLDPEVGFDPS
jgi:transposase InsO family protein